MSSGGTYIRKIRWIFILQLCKFNIHFALFILMSSLGLGETFLKPLACRRYRITHLEDRNQRPLGETGQYLYEDSLLYRKCDTGDERLVIQDSLISSILSMVHDHPISGNLGVRKTIIRAQSKQHNSVRKYVRGCLVCQERKARNVRPPGLMMSTVMHAP